MSEFITIVYGDSPVVVPSRTFNKVCIIGKAGFSGVVDNIKAQDLDPNNISIAGLQASDNLYKAAQKFFGLNPSGTAVLAGIPTSPSSVDNVEFIETLDGIWSSGYSPVDGMSTFEVYATDSSQLAVGDAPDMWYPIASTGAGIEIVTDNGVKPGTIEVGPLTFTAPATTTGYVMGEGDRIRATVTPNGLSSIFKDITSGTINFEFFAFAYDSSLLGINATTHLSEKYTDDECVAGNSWLHDVITGINMCNQFNAAGQRTIFCFGLPEKVHPTEEIEADLCSGTPFAANPIRYEDLRSKLGAHKFVAGFVTKQAAGDNAVDPGIAGMASLSKSAKRDALTFYGEAIGNDEWPDAAERMLWRNAQLNAFIYIKEGGGMVWGNQQTFGQGLDGDINYIRCKNILAYRITEALYTLLYQRSTRYDLEGITKIRNTIAAVLNASTGLYIDGPGKIVIPVEDLLKREASLDEGEKATLDSKRASKMVDNIGVGYRWNRDVEFIYISALLVE